MLKRDAKIVRRLAEVIATDHWSFSVLQFAKNFSRNWNVDEIGEMRGSFIVNWQSLIRRGLGEWSKNR